MSTKSKKIFKILWWINLLCSIWLIICKRYLPQTFKITDQYALTYMLIILFIYGLHDSMKAHEINSQIEYIFILLISLIFCFSILFYYYLLPKNRLSESVFIYFIFAILKLKGKHNIPGFSTLKKGI